MQNVVDWIDEDRFLKILFVALIFTLAMAAWEEFLSKEYRVVKATQKTNEVIINGVDLVSIDEKGKFFWHEKPEKVVSVLIQTVVDLNRQNEELKKSMPSQTVEAQKPAAKK